VSSTPPAFEQLLADRLDLGASDTPLHALDSLRGHLGPRAPRLWLKRDDLMPRALGGNKLRKLEFLLAEARARHARSVATIGGPTSNHLRITAAATCWLGMRPVAYVIGNADRAQGGNLELLHLLGALVVEVPRQLSLREAGAWAQQDFATRGLANEEPGFWITFGGACLKGDWGYVRAGQEIVAQLARLGRRPRALFSAIGTGGTFVGLAAGTAISSPETETIGYAVTPKGAQVFSGLPSIPSQLNRLVSALREAGCPVADPRIRVEYGELGAGYAEPTEAAQAAIELLARTEAIFLDPVYTGKAFAGLLSEIRSGRFTPEDDLVFVHTGGQPGLFFERAPAS
jgi:1-aminocyclopropane-1-carboxylate deaminase/D-cysteine desulfhydrase-like pyridoxal-dependent ACC family enzyme